MKKRIFFSLVFILAIGFNLNAQNPGSDAPDFTVDLLGDEDFTLSDHAGKVVLLFFFGNTCPYCYTSGPKVQEIYTRFIDSSNFVVLGLDTWDSSSSSESVAAYQSTAGVSFPLAIKAGSVSSAYETTYDRLVIIDQEGIIRHKGTTAAVNDASSASAIIFDLLTVVTEPTTGTDLRSGGDSKVKLLQDAANKQLSFEFSIWNEPIVDFAIYSITGKEVKRVHQNLGFGTQRLSIETQSFQAGIYIYKLLIDGELAAGRIVIL
jgi:peroxiredoxin